MPILVSGERRGGSREILFVGVRWDTGIGSSEEFHQ